MPSEHSKTTENSESDAAPPTRVAKAHIDESLRRASETGQVPGVVAMAADERAIIYEGAFGLRDLSRPMPMTLDTVFKLASMTKTVTSVAVMQLVERGALALDEPLGRFARHFESSVVLQGFASDGSPVLRPAQRPVTMRHLITHTSGLGGEIWSPELVRYQQATGLPPIGSEKRIALELPLLFDPGERWEYGIGHEWAGLIVEAVTGVTLGEYFRENIFAPLGMRDTTFGLVPEHQGRAATIHQRDPDGSLRPIARAAIPCEYESGGGGLYGTAPDYLTVLRMLLNRGKHGKRRLLKPETVDLMWQNHIGDVQVTMMKTADPIISNDFEIYPGASKRWSLGAMMTMDQGPDGRSAGSQAWGGIANCFFWLDPVKRITGLLLTQILPFGDAKVLNLLGEFERSVYGRPAPSDLV
jgi:CubicO group peptidase (beta-lactamase class C family)